MELEVRSWERRGGREGKGPSVSMTCTSFQKRLDLLVAAFCVARNCESCEREGSGASGGGPWAVMGRAVAGAVGVVVSVRMWLRAGVRRRRNGHGAGAPVSRRVRCRGKDIVKVN